MQICIVIHFHLFLGGQIPMRVLWWAGDVGRGYLAQKTVKLLSYFTSASVLNEHCCGPHHCYWLVVLVLGILAILIDHFSRSQHLSVACNFLSRVGDPRDFLILCQHVYWCQSCSCLIQAAMWLKLHGIAVAQFLIFFNY